jgi:hypothetical protein
MMISSVPAFIAGLEHAVVAGLVIGHGFTLGYTRKGENGLYQTLGGVLAGMVSAFFFGAAFHTPSP